MYVTLSLPAPDTWYTEPHRIEDPTQWDKARTLRMATATACVMAPTSWLIVMRLEKLFPGTGPRAVLAKTVANGAFFVCRSLLMKNRH